MAGVAGAIAGATALVPPTTAGGPPTAAPTLPATGSDAGVIAVWALAALALGGALTVAVRRRRTI